MSTFQEEAVCDNCGGTYLREFNTKTGEYERVTHCKCSARSERVEQLEKENARLRKELENRK